MVRLRKRRFLKNGRRRAMFLAAALALGTANAWAQDQPWNGVLESQGQYAVIFRTSPESGDLVGHVFRSDSAAGRHILKNCLPGMPCALDHVRLRPFSSAVGDRLGFEDQPSGWVEIMSAEGARVVSGIEEPQAEVMTRHGLVATDPKNLTLRWRGKPLWPAGTGRFSIMHQFDWGPDDLVLVQDSRSDVSCPALYRFVLISAQAAVSSPAFGTCSDLIYTFMQEDDGGKPRAIVRMVGETTPSDSGTGRQRAARMRVEYVFSDGRLTRDGKPVAGPGSSGRGLR